MWFFNCFSKSKPSFSGEGLKEVLDGKHSAKTAQLYFDELHTHLLREPLPQGLGEELHRFFKGMVEDTLPNHCYALYPFDVAGDPNEFGCTDTIWRRNLRLRAIETAGIVMSRRSDYCVDPFDKYMIDEPNYEGGKMSTGRGLVVMYPQRKIDSYVAACELTVPEGRNKKQVSSLVSLTCLRLNTLLDRDPSLAITIADSAQSLFWRASSPPAEQDCLGLIENCVTKDSRAAHQGLKSFLTEERVFRFGTRTMYCTPPAYKDGNNVHTNIKIERLLALCP